MRQVINKINEIDFNATERPPHLRRHLRTDPQRPAKRRQRRRVLHAARRHPVHRRSRQPATGRNRPRPGLRHRRLSCLHHRTQARADRQDRKTKKSCKNPSAASRKSTAAHAVHHQHDPARHRRAHQHPTRQHPEPSATDYASKDRVDVIVTNPPFGGMEEDGIENNFPANFRTRETADLFLALIIQLLKTGAAPPSSCPTASSSAKA